MLREFVEMAAEQVSRYERNLQAASEILNDLYGPALKVHGVGRVVVTGPRSVTLTVRGRLAPQANVNGHHHIRAFARAVELDLTKVKEDTLDQAARELERALAAYVPEGDGAYVWIVPDGYMAELSENERRWAREGGCGSAPGR